MTSVRVNFFYVFKIFIIENLIFNLQLVDLKFTFFHVFNINKQNRNQFFLYIIFYSNINA